MSQNGKYSFNTKRFKEFVDNRRTTPTTVAKAIGKSNGGIAQRWYEGSDISAEHICKLANKYGLHPLMFFNEDGNSMYAKHLLGAKEEDEKPERVSSSTENQNRTDIDILQLELEHQKELHAKEVECLNRIAEMQKTIRQEMKYETEADRIRIEDRYEEKLSRKDEQITKLMTQLADLQAQYKELELAQRSTGGFGYPIGAAEESHKDYLSK